MGALAAFRQKYPRIQVVAGAEEAPYIDGEKKSLRLQQAEKLQETLPQSRRPLERRFCKILRRYSRQGWILQCGTRKCFPGAAGVRWLRPPAILRGIFPLSQRACHDDNRRRRRGGKRGTGGCESALYAGYAARAGVARENMELSGGHFSLLSRRNLSQNTIEEGKACRVRNGF